jgi:phosphoribosylformimino-5-aminoimidazole carboxamide ribotide isomerase
MIVYPSIDVRGGKVVRLREGDPSRQITFGDDPVATAQIWLSQGADWLHMVNLDGTFAQANDNGTILERVAQLGARVQFGGGLRSLENIAQAFKCGASRVILGTLAVEQPEMVMQALERWGTERVGVALDARNGKVATHGWQQITDHSPVELGKQMAAFGVRHALFTDVNRDGGLGGVNLETTIALGRETDLQVIASGGVTTTDEIHQLARSGVVAGAVIGMALYEGRLTLKQALEAAAEG